MGAWAVHIPSLTLLLAFATLSPPFNVTYHLQHCRKDQPLPCRSSDLARCYVWRRELFSGQLRGDGKIPQVYYSIG
jgi:hypothetical protein